MNYNWNRQVRNDNLGMTEVYKNGVLYLQFPLLQNEDYLSHGFSTRVGGVSEGIYSSMNLSFHRGDKKEAVEENYRRISSAIGIPMESIVCSVQTHTCNVKIATVKDKGKGIIRETDYQDVDGLITNETNLPLAIFVADCVPVFLVDPINRAIGLCHAGWRGTAGKITEQAIHMMEQEYGSKPQDMLAAVGPSICQSCYEVSEDVIDNFRNKYTDQEINAIAIAKPNHKYQLDLWKANRITLEQVGIPKESIQVTDICTCCNDQLLFSHRASHGRRGNLAAFLMLKE